MACTAGKIAVTASSLARLQPPRGEGQQFILRLLWAEDGLAPGEIAKRLGIATPTVTRAATRMEAAGLLRREPHPGDRRLVRLVLTDRALATFSPAERASLIQALADIRHNLTD